MTAPTIFHLKKLIKHLHAGDSLLLFADLHGHSRKRNIFAYGCERPSGPLRLRERVFPRLLADCPHFSYPGCSFKVLRSKDNTGRVVVNKQFSQPNSFTIEASFCGADFGAGAGSHFNIKQLKEMGTAFVPALLDFIEPSQATSRARCCARTLDPPPTPAHTCRRHVSTPSFLSWRSLFRKPTTPTTTTMPTPTPLMPRRSVAARAGAAVRPRSGPTVRGVAAAGKWRRTRR